MPPGWVKRVASFPQGNWALDFEMSTPTSRPYPGIVGAIAGAFYNAKGHLAIVC